MASFNWDSHFLTGLTDVDEQHYRLVELINRFGDALGQTQDEFEAEFVAVFNELIEYTHYHFQEEESLMEKVGVDPRHVASQKSAHRQFVEEVIGMHGNISATNLAGAENLLRFLVAWLAYHILGTDQAMARQIKAIQSGMTHEEAYARHERLIDGAMEPIVTALNELFHQISERNRQLVRLNESLETKVAERTGELSKANAELVAVVAKLEEEKLASLRLSRELEGANRRLHEMSMTDVLTGLPNRRHAISRLEDEWQGALAKGTPLSCMMIDADGFKQINDNYGHDAGDAVLKALARELLHSVRSDDAVCRLGGDEFLVICPRTPLEGAFHLAEEMRLAVNRMRVDVNGGQWLGSISVGVAVGTDAMPLPEHLLKAADNAVYIAKRRGRNCVATT